MKKTGLILLIAAAPLLADFSYEQTSKITGGMMASMMKFAGAFSKQAREPIQTTVVVKGDRMAHLSPTHASIVDLGNETITTIDTQKKQYSVMTFAEMKQALEDMSKKMQQKGAGKEDANVDFKVSVTPTGNTKQILGLDTKEMIVKMAVEGTDQKSGEKGAMTITIDSWLAPSISGYEEVRRFYQRMAEKLAWEPGGGFMGAMMNRPDIAKGMGEAMKEMAKLDGVPVYQLIKMGGEGQPGAAGQNTTSTPPAQQQQSQPQAEKPSAGGALAGALGGRLGRFGGLGRKKQEPKAEEQAAQPAPQGDASAALMEMTTELSGFSAAQVDASKFEVPAGFKKVEPDMKRMSR